MNVNSYSSGSLASCPCEMLAYGKFYGVFEWQYEIPCFSLALIAPDDTAVKGIKHCHETAHIIFVLGGQYVTSAAGFERALPSRTLIFVPAGTTHQNHPQTSRTRILTISISESQIRQAHDYVRLPEAEANFRQGEIDFLASRLEAECRVWRHSSALTAAGLCLELLAAIANRTQLQERKPPRWLQTAVELLHDRCCEPVSISEVAEAAGVHPIHLSRTFRRFFNCTPSDYLRNCRLERAASLLRLGNRSIARVAYESGFSNQSQFSKAFRRKFGITPVEFRRNVSKNVRF